MTENALQFPKSPIDIDGPIDFEQLRHAVESLGPLRISRSDNPYSVEIDIYRCPCGRDGCLEYVVGVRRRNGIFSIRWTVSPAELLEFASLGEFNRYVLLGALDDTSCERQIMETEIENILEKHYSDVDAMPCLCSECAAAMGPEELGRRMVLSQLALTLAERDNFIGFASETPGNAGRDNVSEAFDLGYLAGRIFSEYQVKAGIEAYALAGMGFEKLKAKRAHKAGEKSAGKRIERIASLVAHMERLAGGSPAVLRIGPLGLARLAGQDASAENPSLWSQGLGQVEEYLGLVRRGEAGEALQARYLSLFPPKLHRH
ncbi:hypothetical protein OSH10_04920 [Kaistia defluvii]|uniref:hypothetical protein n=1 Tax=Kaistia defluvii TaxID=410841 RepID=UPI00225000FB|nr:hypothetical protein [Kaistia defluvii]MCX5517768.1 hypothetical protein [Kaistia defluvii]